MVLSDLFVRTKKRVASDFNIADNKKLLQLYQESDLQYPPARHKLNWSTKRCHLDLLYQLIRTIKPKVIVETGTYEAHGTFAMSAATHENDNGAVLYTVDYDGDPVQDEQGTVSLDEWLELKHYRENNLAQISEQFPRCAVKFIEGDSRQVLKGEVLPALVEVADGKWDFWYQDSMHYVEGIRQEWEIMAPHASERAIVIFDDVSKRNEFSVWFLNNKSLKRQWQYISRRDFQHKQCWAQRLLEN